MPVSSSAHAARTALIVGASRGLGLGIATEIAARGWSVIGTVRGEGGNGLRDLADRPDSRVCVEMLDIDEPDQIAALQRRLAGQRIDLLFVNAGIAPHDPNVRMGDVATDEFARVMLTNALGPMRVIEALQDLVPADGLIGAMSSGQGSIANNLQGMREVYRASKAALNMLMRSFAAREQANPRALLLMAPGWIKTDLGGADAPFTLGESVPKLVDLLFAKQGRPGLEYLDRDGNTVPW